MKHSRHIPRQLHRTDLCPIPFLQPSLHFRSPCSAQPLPKWVLGFSALPHIIKEHACNRRSQYLEALSKLSLGYVQQAQKTDTIVAAMTRACVLGSMSGSWGRRDRLRSCGWISSRGPGWVRGVRRAQCLVIGEHSRLVYTGLPSACWVGTWPLAFCDGARGMARMDAWPPHAFCREELGTLRRHLEFTQLLALALALLIQEKQSSRSLAEAVEA